METAFKKKLFAMILSYCSIHSLQYAMKLKTNSLALSNSVIAIVIVYAFYIVILNALKIVNKRLFLYAYSLGWLFSAMVISGTTIYTEGKFNYSFASLIRGIVSVTQLSIIFAAVIALFIYYIPYIKEKALSLPINTGIFSNMIKNERKYFFIVWAIIFIAWIPCFLAYFPGVFSYDTPWQIYQAFTGEFNTHHPILHTYYLYACLKAGMLLGSYEMGAAIHSITQMLMLSAAFAYACRYMLKLKVPVTITILSAAYFALFPLHPIWAVNATKDVLFSAAVLMVFIFVLDMVIYPKAFFSSSRLQMRLLLFIFLMLSLRNNGFHIFLLLIPFMVFGLKGYRSRTLALCIAAICVYQIPMGFVGHMLNVDKGNIGETLSVPIQQLARTINYAGAQVSEEDKQIIFEIIPEEDIYKYAPHISDPVKEHFNQKNFKSDPKKYIKLWIGLGLEFPGIYIDSFANNVFGLWYPDIIWRNKQPSLESYIITENIKSTDEIDLKQNTLFPAGLTFYNNIAVYSEYEDIPVISMMFSMGFAFWMLLLSGVTCFYYKKYRLALPMVILLALWFSLLFSPVVLVRYVYPLFVCKPILFGILFNRVDSLQMEED